MKCCRLNNGVEMPLLGFGTFQIEDLDICRRSVLSALKVGYRLIDTASCYHNEEAVGEAIRESGIPREEIFLSSKVWIVENGYEETIATFEESLRKLGTDYLDLYLIHMPLGDVIGSYRALMKLRKEGRVRVIGVCNFLSDRLLDLMLTTKDVPQVNQIECHPFDMEKGLRKDMLQNNIQSMAWAPFAEGREDIFHQPILVRIAKGHSCPVSHVILAYLMAEGNVVIPKSVHEERIAENFQSLSLSLSKEERAEIATLDRDKPLILDIQTTAEVERLHKIH